MNAARLGAPLLLLVVLATGCQDRHNEVAVFHAASLARTFKQASDAFTREQPQYRVRLEVSGSQTAARKVAELGMRADVIAVADVRVIDDILIPEHATWKLGFATNELVIAHDAHSRFTEEITTDNWPTVLLRPGVRLGCVDPDLAPIGYRTLHSWQLAEKHSDANAGLSQKLRARCVAEQIMPDEGELVRLLVSRSVDYVFLYRSTAFEQRLKVTRLPADCNLGDRQRAADYAQARVDVRMKRGQARMAIIGAPILYGVSIPRSAPNRAGGAAFVDFLLGEPGNQILKRSGFAPIPNQVRPAGE